jgi:hypothetical protein
MVWSAVGTEYRRVLGRVTTAVPMAELAGSLAAVNA